MVALAGAEAGHKVRTLDQGLCAVLRQGVRPQTLRRLVALATVAAVGLLHSGGEAIKGHVCKCERPKSEHRCEQRLRASNQTLEESLCTMYVLGTVFSRTIRRCHCDFKSFGIVLEPCQCFVVAGWYGIQN